MVSDVCFGALCSDVGGGHYPGEGVSRTVREWDVWLWAAERFTGTYKLSLLRFYNQTNN